MAPIENAPADGRYVWVWSPREPGVMRRARYGFVGKHKRHWGWISPRGCMLSNIPTHFADLPEPEIPALKAAGKE